MNHNGGNSSVNCGIIHIHNDGFAVVSVFTLTQKILPEDDPSISFLLVGSESFGGIEVIGGGEEPKRNPFFFRGCVYACQPVVKLLLIVKSKRVP